jgi:hypothetical protein
MHKLKIKGAYRWLKLILLINTFLWYIPSQALPIKENQDSTKLYTNIESYSRRNKLIKFFYRLIFRPIASEEPKKKIKKKSFTRLIQKPMRSFEGKVIRNIHIETLDPFGYSIADTIQVKQNFFLKGGNASHIKTQRNTIRNLLLIHKNQLYDSLLVKESERLVRRQSYVRDVSFYSVAASKNSDSVDIFIRELDKWSITPKIGASPSRVVVKLSERNFLGWGHESQNNYTWHHRTGADAFYTDYYIPNIKNTYISTALHYGTDEYNHKIMSFAIDRSFFSPFAKWAGGGIITQDIQYDSILVSDTSYIPQRFKTYTQDYWVGNSMQLFKGNTENNRSTNFISALHFIRTKYAEKPEEMYDLSHAYRPENIYLASAGISTRKYVQDKFIFNYGIPEDVPVGKVYALTLGYQEKNKTGRTYLSGRISFGNFFSWGYMSSNYEYSTYLRALKAEQGILSISIIYFTHLLEIGKWRFREFAKPQLTFGINRNSAEGLNINDGNGIDGFNSSDLIGTNRLLLKLQTQSYAPWNVIGFRFGPYLIYSVGMLSDAKTGFKRSKIYSQIGIGMLIKNDNLVFNTFQFSVSYYPSIPGYKQDVFKVNSFKSSDFGYRDFEIGKPSINGYQ